MKITLFTFCQIRHEYLINLLSQVCTELNVVQEYVNNSAGKIPGNYPPSKTMEKYFNEVIKTQENLFKFNKNNKTNINLMRIKARTLSSLPLNNLKNFLSSDCYIVFGSSYIKGDLVDFLVKNKALNIHMGVSPFYRGTDCNFWSLYDDNPHLVGATIHLLSKGLDSGPILYHAMSNLKNNPFEYSMSTVKSAFHSLAEKIKNKSILNIKPENQDKSLEIRYSRRVEFNDDVVEKFFEKKIDLNKKLFDNKLLKNPFFYY